MNNDIITYTEESRSIMFQSHRLSAVKFDAIYNLGEYSVDKMNEISEYVIDHWSEFYNSDYCSFVSAKTFITMIRKAFNKAFSNTFDGETYKIIHTGYVNKCIAIKKKLTIKEKQVRDILYYKKRTTKFEVNENGEKVKVVKEPGDVREIRYKYVETDKTKVLSFLAKYGTKKTYEWLNHELKTSTKLSAQKRKDYEKYIKMFEIYGFEVLLEEALKHRQEVFDEYITPCVFVSNTLHIDSRINNTFIYNKKNRSCVHAFVELAIPYTYKDIEHEHMFIPIKYKKSYHGKLEQYNAVGKNNHIYMVCCLDKSGRIVDFHISKKLLVAHRAPTENDVYTAFDVNTNGNKLVGTNDIIIGHEKDEKLVAEIAKLNKALKDGQSREKKLSKKQNRPYKTSNAMSNRKRRKLKKMNSVMSEHNRQDAAKAITEAKTNGSNHIVFENIDGKFGKSKAKNKENDQNFNDKTSAMQISSIKNHAIGICQKKHMSVSLVQPEYTSQRCPKCGCIHKENRKTQDTFECVECGYTLNADKNASDNILHRVVSRKLCEALLKQIDDGYVPNKSISHDKLLDIISQFSCDTLPPTSYLERNENTLKLDPV